VNAPLRAAPGAATASSAAAPAARPVLYLFSALPPQRNGLADYIAEYLEPLARDYRLSLVADSIATREIAAHHACASFEVIDEAAFSARMPDPEARILYNLGNNKDCIFMLDYLHRYPGTVILHDVSLFYLHQITLQQQRANGMMNRWLLEDGYRLPDLFINADGSLASTPGFVYQECLMVRRVVESARSVVVHSGYAHRRALGGVTDPGQPTDLARKFCRMPHFVLTPPEQTAAESAVTLARFGLKPDDFVCVVPGFLTGNKMLYEVLVAFQRAKPRHARLKLVYAGEERKDEYDISEKIELLYPDGDGPIVTGYLASEELDALLNRADLSFVLRYPTYGETSGILPRAVMGGGRVVTVDIGSYPEFESELIERVPVGPGLPTALEAAIDRAIASHPTEAPRILRQAEARRRTAAMAPGALYGSLRNAIEQGVRATAGANAGTSAGAPEAVA
jgi:glycosyltransferase involved in cell wall biosynthesis